MLGYGESWRGKNDEGQMWSYSIYIFMKISIIKKNLNKHMEE